MPCHGSLRGEDAIRTRDILLARQALFRTELHPRGARPAEAERDSLIPRSCRRAPASVGVNAGGRRAAAESIGIPALR